CNPASGSAPQPLFCAVPKASLASFFAWVHGFAKLVLPRPHDRFTVRGSRSTVKDRMSLPIEIPGVSAGLVIEIGGFPIEVQTTDPEFERILNWRYGGYIRPGRAPEFALRVHVANPEPIDPDADAEVWLDDREWKMTRGDFSASWSPAERRGEVR